MKHTKTLCTMVLGFHLISSIMVYSQETANIKLEIIDKCNSKNDALISKCYWLLVNDDGRVKPEYRDDVEIKNSLWNALKFLVPKPVVVKSPDSEGNTTADYLLYIVGDVRETRAIPYLLENIHFGGFRDSLARMGDEAIVPVLKMFESGNEAEKQYATEILEKMVAPKPKEIVVGYRDPVNGFSHKTIANSDYGLYEASGEVREKIKVALKKQLYEKPVNLSILSAYKYIADEEDVKFLENIAQNDTHKRRVMTRRVAGTPEQIKEKYPLREEAQKALDLIKAKKTEMENNKADVQKSTTTN